MHIVFWLYAITGSVHCVLSLKAVHINLLFCLFILFDFIHPSQQIFSYVGMCLPGLNLYLAGINVSCSRTQCSTVGEAQTRNPSTSSQALYH